MVELTHTSRFHGSHDLGWPIVTITVRKNDGDNSPHFRTRMRLHVSVLSSNKGYNTQKKISTTRMCAIPIAECCLLRHVVHRNHRSHIILMYLPRDYCHHWYMIPSVPGGAPAPWARTVVLAANSWRLWNQALYCTREKSSWTCSTRSEYWQRGSC